MTKTDFISAMYDVLCEEFDSVFRRLDACKFDSEGCCALARKLNKTDPNYCDHHKDFKSCCDYHRPQYHNRVPCLYHSPNGCTMKCIKCKSFECPLISDKLNNDKDDKPFIRFWKLKDLTYRLEEFAGYRYGSNYFLSKEDWMKNIKLTT